MHKDPYRVTNAWTQPADGYGGVSQGLPPDHRQVIKA